MKKYVNTIKLIAFVIITMILINSCSKTKESEAENSGPTRLIFWIDSDFGCGPITVNINGKSAEITGYNAKEPYCGNAYSATYELSKGTYNFTASCSGKTWSGSVQVEEGKCNAYQLTSSGGSAGSGGTGGTGSGGTGGGGTGGGGTGTATVTTPNTQFIASQDHSVSASGAYWTEQFTITKSTTLVFRFTAQFQAQAAIFKPDQLSNFQTKKTFSGLGLFDKKIGTNTVTLSPGTYYVGARNSTNGPNKWSIELDYDITLPAGDRATFVDIYAQGAESLTAGTRLSQPFTIQKGYRYFLDGCNVNCDVRIIEASQLSAFKNNSSYQYLTNFYNTGGAAPGLFDLQLPPGDYYLVSYNSVAGSLTYSMERWKVN